MLVEKKAARQIGERILIRQHTQQRRGRRGLRSKLDADHQPAAANVEHLFRKSALEIAQLSQQRIALAGALSHQRAIVPFEEIHGAERDGARIVVVCERGGVQVPELIQVPLAIDEQCRDLRQAPAQRLGQQIVVAAHAESFRR